MARTAFLIKAATLASIATLSVCTASIARAQAEAPAFDLQWSAPPTCMSAGAARGAIGALIREQRTAGERARARVLIEGSEQQGYVARIEIARGASAGERELRGAGCAAVADAAVLIVAMAIDPEGASARAAAADAAKPAPEATSSSSTTPRSPPEREAKPEEKPTPPPPAKVEEPEPEQQESEEEEEDEEAEAEEEEPEEEEPPSDPRQAGRFVLGLHGTGDAGSLPRATVGGGVLGGMHWQQLRLELHALAYVPQVEDRAPAPGSTDVSLYTGVLRGCFDLLGVRDEPRALGACAAIEAGLSRGAPRSISDGQASAGFWLASFVGVDVRQRLAGPLHVRLLVEAGLPVLRPSYEIDPFGRVFHASPVLGRFAISAFVLFP